MPDPISRLNTALAGRYRIERQLGEGGMALVYLADDLRHGRKVAVKVLRPELAAVVGAERFLAEIKTTANLQHPHILPLFDSGEADTFLFYVMPYVEGESLRDRLDREHQLPVDEAVAIATKVAGALQAAHSRGVIHRDIKPANILLAGGEPVVSDFGIALALGAAGAGRLTETGLSLGTPHYMSPEQATGDMSVGAATDIYALGCVLYEMLVGEPPYTGSTPQAVLGKIVTGEADPVTKHRRSVSPHVDAAIRRALEKVPADRFHSAQEMAHALGDVGFRHGADAATPAAAVTSVRADRLSLAGWGVAAVLALGAGWAVLRPSPSLPVTRFELTLQEGLAGSSALDISPDGRTIVFWAWGEADPDGSLYVRRLDDLTPTQIPGTEGAWRPRFSPDGSALAFIDVTEGDLRVMALDGTPPVTLVSDSAFYAQGLSWASDGMIYFGKYAANSGLWRVPEGGGAPEEVAALAGRWVQRAALLPSGRGILFSGAAGVEVLSTVTDEVTTLFPGGSPHYAQSGHIVYLSPDAVGTLMAVPFDEGELRVTGPARALTEGLFVGVDGWPHFAMSESGTLVYVSGRTGPGEGELVWLNGSGAEAVSPELSGVIEGFSLSPDGRRIAFDRTSGQRRDVWVYDEDGATARITFDGDANIRPRWSPDGREIGYVSVRDDVQSFYSVPAEGGTPKLLRAPAPGTLVWEGIWTPDSRWLLYRQLPRNDVGHLLFAAPHPDSLPRPWVETEFFNVSMSISPDGRWIAYQSDESGQREVYIRPFPGPGAPTLVSRGGGSGPIWSDDGRRIVYVSGGNWVAATVTLEPAFRVVSREPIAPTEGYITSGLIQRYDLSPDGERILAIRDLSDAPTRTIIVQNFFEELRALAPN